LSSYSRINPLAAATVEAVHAQAVMEVVAAAAVGAVAAVEGSELRTRYEVFSGD